MVHSPLVFLYNALILYATLVLASLSKRRVFFFTIISIFWLGIGIINGVILTQQHDAVHRQGSELISMTA